MIFCIETDGFSKCHISFLGCDVPKNQWENPRFGEPSSGGAKPLKITLESPPVFQKMGDGLNLPKPVLNTENPRLFTRCFLGFEGDVLRIRSHGKSQCFTTIWENICLLFLTICHGANQIWHPMPAVGICFSSKFKNLQLCNYMGVSLIGFVVYDSYRFVTSTTLTKFQDPRIIFPGCLTVNVRISICVFHIERFFVPSKIQTNCYIVFSMFLRRLSPGCPR